jgi:hypothetical protein
LKCSSEQKGFLQTALLSHSNGATVDPRFGDPEARLAVATRRALEKLRGSRDRTAVLRGGKRIEGALESPFGGVGHGPPGSERGVVDFVKVVN